ncbi:MAG TPA: GNAT family N-acetyltransferase, partial [Gemmatimonadaceae bacterium]|nr:GNAT family N-acetyltransferase [Gemmatimonadaceae bacterium]
MHNFPITSSATLSLSKPTSTISALVRRAVRPDAPQILELVAQYAAQGLMLPRTLDQIAARIDNYVVATDRSGRVIACAALEEYSPSLAEVSSVAVAPPHHGKGLGSQVVLGIERLARARDIEELFALSLTDNFFLSLSYNPTTISRYPEKLARYETLTKSGVEIVPKRC